jgi:hypothetical protein
MRLVMMFGFIAFPLSGHPFHFGDAENLVSVMGYGLLKVT